MPFGHAYFGHLMRPVILFVFLTLSLAASIGCVYLASDGVYLLVHVPAAMISYAGFGFCVLLNLAFLLGRRIEPRIGHIACELGLLFALVTMISGGLWGLEAWGKAWTWEPRLMGLLLTTLIFASWRLAQSQIVLHTQESASISAKLIVLGLPALIFTHVAVRLFGGMHPETLPPEAVNGGTHAGMWLTSIIAQIGLAASFVIWRTRPKALPKIDASDG